MAPPAPPDKGLRAGALGFGSSLVLGLASTAPAYSLAATIGALVAVVGLQAPAAMLLGFVPMLLVAIAFQQLNRAEPDCGTTFTWAARAFGPRTGWLGGWGVVVADVLVMANLAQISAQYGYDLVGADALADSRLAVAVAGVAWIAGLTWVCYRGIEVSARLQVVALGVEMIALVLVAGTALTAVYRGTAGEESVRPALSWLDPTQMPSLDALSSGLLLAVFVYWGWDTALSVNEETRDRTRLPGLAAVVSTVLLVATYVLVTVAVVAYVGPTALAADESGDVLAVVGEAVLGSVGGQLLVLAVLTSAAASTLTTILPTARTTLSMGAVGALPDSFARVHPRYLTPTVSTAAMGVVSAIVYLVLVAISQDVLDDSVAATALAIAFYYGLTGVACPVYFRRELGRGWRPLLLRGVLPGLGGLLLLAALVRSVIDLASPANTSSSVFGIGTPLVVAGGSLALGLVLMVVQAARSPAWFRRRDRSPTPG